MSEIVFSDEVNSRQIDGTSMLIRAPRLWAAKGDYPAHTEWADMAIDQVIADEKFPWSAWIDRQPAGSLVWQLEGDQAYVKFLNVAELARGRGLARCMFEQLRHTLRTDHPNVSAIGGDAKASNVGMIAFARSVGASVTLALDLETNFASNGEPNVRFYVPIKRQQSALEL